MVASRLRDGRGSDVHLLRLSRLEGHSPMNQDTFQWVTLILLAIILILILVRGYVR